MALVTALYATVIRVGGQVEVQLSTLSDLTRACLPGQCHLDACRAICTLEHVQLSTVR